MQTGQSTIKTMFDGAKIFKVPVYQRAYSWDEDNLWDFFSDVKNQHPERRYFFGSFLLHKTGTRDDFSTIDIVDGQQRITTFIIFINILIKSLLSFNSKLVSTRSLRIFVKDEDIFKIELNNEDSSFLHHSILSGTCPDKGTAKTPSQSLLIRAREFFEKNLKTLDQSTQEKLFETITNADVLLYVVDNLDPAIQIFELLNDRGRRLTDLESIKSYLMYNITLLTAKPTQIISDIQSDFAEIYRIIEKYEINDQDVLRYHTIAFEFCPADFQEKPKEFIKNKIVSMREAKDLKGAKDEISNYSKRLRSSFETFSQISEEKFKNPELAKVFMIGRVAPFFPLLMKIHKDDKGNFLKSLEAIQKFTFRASLVSLRSNGESYIYTKLRNKEDPIQQVKEFTQDNWWNLNNRAIEALDTQNYYEWISKNVVRYILVSYENSLREEKGFPLISFQNYITENSREKLSIEHITAQKAKDLVFDDDFSKNYLHNIGNLVIDHAASNTGKGNNNTEDKLEDLNLAPIMSQNELDERKEFKCNWRNLESVKRFIQVRNEHMKKFIKDYFQL